MICQCIIDMYVLNIINRDYLIKSLQYIRKIDNYFHFFISIIDARSLIQFCAFIYYLFMTCKRLWHVLTCKHFQNILNIHFLSYSLQINLPNMIISGRLIWKKNICELETWFFQSFDWSKLGFVHNLNNCKSERMLFNILNIINCVQRNKTILLLVR